MVQDASYIYQELGEKYNWTVRTLTNLKNSPPFRDFFFVHAALTKILPNAHPKINADTRLCHTSSHCDVWARLFALRPFWLITT
jgi:hypothetical protein